MQEPLLEMAPDPITSRTSVLVVALNQATFKKSFCRDRQLLHVKPPLNIGAFGETMPLQMHL